MHHGSKPVFHGCNAICNVQTKCFLAVNEDGSVTCADTDISAQPNIPHFAAQTPDNKMLLSACAHHLYLSAGPDGASLLGKADSDALSEWTFEPTGGEHEFFVKDAAGQALTAAGQAAPTLAAFTGGDEQKWTMTKATIPAPAAAP